jgi:hypothetical protein
LRPGGLLPIVHQSTSLAPGAAEYVKERILALRKAHPGQYQNASVVRTNAMKFITNYFKKGQLTKLFFLFAVGCQRRWAPAWTSAEAVLLAGCSRTANAR